MLLGSLSVRGAAASACGLVRPDATRVRPRLAFGAVAMRSSGAVMEQPDDAATSAFFDDLVTFVADRILMEYEGIQTEADRDL